MSTPKIIRVRQEQLAEIGFKWCSKCTEIKPFSDFRIGGRKTATYRYQAHCKDCQDNDKQKRYDLNKSVVWELKNNPCTDCNEIFHPAAMDFDHINEAEKSFNPSEYDRNLTDILKEIDKCELVCSNCHRIRTYNRNQ